MALMIGVDTGGTFTDAVLYDRSKAAVVAKAKALTTHGDLEIGIGEAVDAVIRAGASGPTEIGLVSVSTTLATNATVEGIAEPIGIVMVGFDQFVRSNPQLDTAIREHPTVRIDGGHDAHGCELVPLDMVPLENQLDDLSARVGGFAVTGYFAVRNPEHEKRVRDLLLARTSLPVTCSHELSSGLDAPKRALTTILNARLIGVISRLLNAVKCHLARAGVDAPLMVVRGDGSLVSAQMAVARPIETVFSGPAASLVGAAHLAGRPDAVISDIGGTTTDIAILRNGLPKIDPRGADIGGHRTMVRAVAMSTIGLGGDSEVQVKMEGLNSAIELGPRRVVPISLLASQYGDQVLDILERECKQSMIDSRTGRFAVLISDGGVGLETLTTGEQEMVERLRSGPISLGALIVRRPTIAVLDRLVARRLVALSGVTPSDAAHLLGLYDAWNGAAARLGLRLFGRVKTVSGKWFCDDEMVLAEQIITALVRRSGEALLDAALADDNISLPRPSNHPVIAAALDRKLSTSRINVGLQLPIVGLGASAATYYPRVGQLLDTETFVPEHADVANAVGAVAGLVRAQAECTVSRLEGGRYRVHLRDRVEEFSAVEEAETHASEVIRALAIKEAGENGAEHIECALLRRDIRAEIEGQDVFIEAKFVATATGRPEIAGGGQISRTPGGV